MGKRIISFIRYILDCMLEVIFVSEDTCIICREEISQGYLCRKCREKIMLCSEKFILKKDRTDKGYTYYSSAYYSDIMMEIILELKYKLNYSAYNFIVEMLLDTINKMQIDFDIITYVPSDRRTRKKRGYNQSQLLAKGISRSLKKPVKNLLKKVSRTKDQIGLSGSDRWFNLKNSFSVQDIESLQDKNILLIDDVITTGATAYYCAKELEKNGAKNIIILTAAKSKI